MTTDTLSPKVTLLDGLIPEFLTSVEAASSARKSGIPIGPVTPFPALNVILGGAFAPGIHVVQAAPGAGKTAFCLQVAARGSAPALYVTAEMSEVELFRRLIARETQTFLLRLKNGELDPDTAMQLAAETVNKVPNFAFVDGTRGYASPEVIRDTAEGLRERAGSRHLLIVVDSLHVWARSARSSELGSASDYDLINGGLNGLSQLAAELACPVVAVAHRNRGGQREGGLHAAKGSGDIEYIAESVIELTSDDAPPDAAGNKNVSVAVWKNRHGSIESGIPLQFSGRLQEFRDCQNGGLYDSQAVTF